MPGAPSSFLLLVVRPGTPSSALAPILNILKPPSLLFFGWRKRPHGILVWSVEVLALVAFAWGQTLQHKNHS